MWLNEGFATWIEYLCIDHCFPNWSIWNYYATEHLLRAYNLDSLNSSHPIEVRIDAPEQIGQVFDDISYCKGSAILRMLSEFVGEQNFTRGLHNYLERFKFGNATSDDLWNEIDAASNEPIKNLMQVWTKKQGFPMVSVSKRVSDRTILVVSQASFLKNKSDDDDKAEALWNIPITIGVKSTYPRIHKKFLINSKGAEIDLGVLKSDDWIVVNVNNSGFYATQYSSEMFEDMLTSLANPNEYGSSLDRYGVINNAFLAVSSNLKANV